MSDLQICKLSAAPAFKSYKKIVIPLNKLLAEVVYMKRHVCDNTLNFFNHINQATLNSNMRVSYPSHYWFHFSLEL